MGETVLDALELAEDSVKVCRIQNKVTGEGEAVRVGRKDRGEEGRGSGWVDSGGWKRGDGEGRRNLWGVALRMIG